MKKQKSKSNKGFSLVELIVVIAIMAVLVGLLAPQFVKYVSQSKSSRNAQNIETLRSTANIVLADPKLVTITTGAKVTVKKGSATSTAITVDTDKKDFVSLFKLAVGEDGLNNLPDDCEWEITITKQDDGGYTATVTQTKGN